MGREIDITPAQRTRFRAFIRKTRTCWLWTGGASGDGYGVFGVGLVRIGTRGKAKAHRLAWFLFSGKIPEGAFVLHECDNKRCVNPSHLFLGDHRANMRDMVAKGRSTRHERNPNAKITAKGASAIRDLYRSGLIQESIGKKFGITQSAVSYIVNSKVWGPTRTARTARREPARRRHPAALRIMDGKANAS